jgi:hypothetical protein
VLVLDPYLGVKPPKILFYNIVVYLSSVVILLKRTYRLKILKTLCPKVIRTFYLTNKLQRKLISASGIISKVNSNPSLVFLPTALFKS